MNMKPLIISVCTVLVAVFLYAIPANAMHTMSCATREKFVELLTKKYGETIRATGVLKGSMGVMEVWQSKTGNWSILMTLPTGQSCMIATGENLEVLNPPKLGSPTNAGL